MLKQLQKFSEFSRDEIREILTKAKEAENYFEVGGYRFIHQDAIDEIQKEELLADKYVLGCFTDWFIADVTGLDIDVIKKAQKDESFELLGELMAAKIDEVQEKYSRADGYGHHFNSYDGNEYEAGNYYFFRRG